jgi:LuxR family transcriptional regulator, maltose regulon positive regulatory protein
MASTISCQVAKRRPSYPGVPLVLLLPNRYTDACEAVCSNLSGRAELSMPRTAEYRLTWQAEQGAYKLQNSRGERLLAVSVEDSTWFAWLTSVTSFTFSGKYAARLTVRKESRRGSETYWYAYHRSGQNMLKKYLGRTTELTFARLEDISRQLTAGTSYAALGTSVQDSREKLDYRQRQVAPEEQIATPISPLSPDLRDDQIDLELKTKLQAPRLRSQLVPRTRLLRRLQQAYTSTLTLLSAPAGFGKTTLLAQWLTESRIPIAWLSLESQDNEPTRFLSYLIAALQTLDPHLGSRARSLLFSPPFSQAVPLEAILTVLTNDLAQQETRDLFLVLDDYHVLTARPIQRIMTFLVEHCPPPLHLILATRADPPLPLARLRAQGQLTELRASQFQFELSEASAFLSEVMALNLSSESIVALQERTEGWIAGLHLAALSLQGRGEVEAFLTDFTGSHRHIADYLVEEVLARQSEEVQSFLLSTSMLEHLCGPLCDAVANRNGSEILLAELERANLFLVPLDEQRHWYRYHRLFADLLRARVRGRFGPEGMAALSLRASEWYEQNGFPMEAVEAALAANDAERAADLLEPLSIVMVLRLQHATLQRWVEQLPREVWFNRPILCSRYAIALFIMGPADAYAVPLQQAEKLLRAAGNDHELGRVYMVRALAASLRGDALEGIRCGQQALTLFPPEALVARSASVSALAEGYRRIGNVRAAWQALNEASPIDEGRGSLFGLSGRAILSARLLVMQSKLRQAAESYRALLGSADDHHEFALEALIGLAELLREANELEEALAHLERVRLLARERGNRVLLARAALVYARIVQAQGAAPQAEAAFATAVIQAQQSDHQQLPAEARCYQVRWWLMQGKREAVGHWHVATAGTRHAPVDYQQELGALTLTRVLLARDDAGDALDLLEGFRAYARDQGRTGSEIEILMLTALASHAQGKPEHALQTLQQALLLAEPEGYVRLFVDEGAPMAVLLRLVLARWKSKRGTDYIHRLLALLEANSSLSPSSSSRSTQIPEAPVLLEPLSPRERKVLRLLVAGLSNPEIANELVVSLNTIKTQVQSLYRKLQVSSRQEAIAAAKRLYLF